MVNIFCVNTQTSKSFNEGHLYKMSAGMLSILEKKYGKLDENGNFVGGGTED
jgi:hypothetical protein